MSSRGFTRANCDSNSVEQGWFSWAGSHWERDRLNTALSLAADFTELKSVQFERKGDIAAAREFGRLPTAKAILTIAGAKAGLASDANAWDARPFLLATPGGTVDLKIGKLRPADPDDMLTRCTSVAPSEDEDCPIWKDFLSQTMGGDVEKIAYIQRWIGYALTGDARARMSGPGRRRRKRQGHSRKHIYEADGGSRQGVDGNGARCDQGRASPD